MLRNISQLLDSYFTKTPITLRKRKKLFLHICGPPGGSRGVYGSRGGKASGSDRSRKRSVEESLLMK